MLTISILTMSQIKIKWISFIIYQRKNVK